MRAELELIKKIEDYLTGQLAGTERVLFEAQLQTDMALAAEASLIQDILKAIERTALKQQVQHVAKAYKLFKVLKWLIIPAVTALIIAALYFANNYHSYANGKLPQYNEAGKKDWADADRNINPTVFLINSDADTVIETPGGITLSIPANNFVDNKAQAIHGDIEFVVKEALTPKEIFLSGLSTVSAGKLLETGGMFFIDARKDGQPLGFVNNIYAEIPADGVKPGMQLFSGLRKNGNIEWVNPTPLEHSLNPVNISLLNFYPPYYLDSIAKWGFNQWDKKFTDSLYYSFAYLFAPATMAVAYVTKPGFEEKQADTITIAKLDSVVNYFSSDAPRCGINPAKIKAIWNAQFQNTILSTREFEERLKLIHFVGREDVLDLYVNNLDKNLCTIDSMAWRQSGEDYGWKFLEFALRNDGKVKNGNRQFDKLREYYANKSKAYADALVKTQLNFWRKQDSLDNAYNSRQAGHQNDSIHRLQQNFQEEFTLNLKDAYKQLGYNPAIKPRPGNSVYKVNIPTAGWYNVDKYVYESVNARASLNYTNPSTGKKAVIQYKPVSFSVNQYVKYDRLYVYLLPSGLNSFMKLTGNNGIYTEQLDELMKYNMVCIAYKGEQAFYYKQGNIEPKNYNNVELGCVNLQQLQQELNNTGNRGQSGEMVNENEYLQYLVKDEKRQRDNNALMQLRDKLIYIIFPCRHQIQNLPALK